MLAESEGKREVSAYSLCVRLRVDVDVKWRGMVAVKENKIGEEAKGEVR